MDPESTEAVRYVILAPALFASQRVTDITRPSGHAHHGRERMRRSPEQRAVTTPRPTYLS